jgi:transcriptional regulator with XRE-family HTH domain
VKPPRRIGALARIEPEVVRALFEASNLTQARFAALAGTSIRQNPSGGGHDSITVTQWLSGKRRMSHEMYEVLTTRLWLLKDGYATFEELTTHPLKVVLKAKMKKPSKKPGTV